jgi:hypothetical protein
MVTALGVEAYTSFATTKVTRHGDINAASR